MEESSKPREKCGLCRNVDRKSSRCSSWVEELSVSLLGLQTKREVQSDYFYESISSCKSASICDTQQVITFLSFFTLPVETGLATQHLSQVFCFMHEGSKEMKRLGNNIFFSFFFFIGGHIMSI